MRNPRTTILGRRIGYNEEKRKRTRAMKMRIGRRATFRWFRHRGWIVCLVLFVVGFAAWTNRFYLQRLNPMELRYLQYIDIEGNRMLTWEDVLQSAQVEPGMLMSEVKPDSVLKTLLQLPLIHSATVEKNFPSSLTIKLQEANPLFTVFEGTQVTAFSERGLPIPVSTMTAFRLPVLDVHSKDRVQEVAALLQTMRQENKNLYEKVSQVAWSEQDMAYEVFFRDVDHKVFFPESGWNKELFAFYESVKSGFSQDLHCAGLVDLRYAGFLYVKNFDKRCVNG